MNKAVFVSGLALAFLGGCSLESTGEVDQFREALPSADSVAVDGPETTRTGDRSASGVRGALTATPGAPAPAYFYTFTRDVRDGVNVVTAAILVTVGFVVHTEPTTVERDRAVWGPYDGDALDPVAWRLTVTRIEDHHYRYVVEGRRKSDKTGRFLAVLEGDGYDRQSPSHGDGTFVLDLDNSKLLDPSRHEADSGTVTIVHDLSRDIGRRIDALPRTITATVAPKTGEFLVIGSVANTDRTGSLDVTAVVDIDDVKDGVNEDVAIASRWRATGAGRADITIAGGSLTNEVSEVDATECWGEDFARVFYSDSIDSKPTEGDETLCAY
ncbi:MAG TPA: hypothetical protein VFZ53_12775 [Polyangiaceae bacterium]